MQFIYATQKINSMEQLSQSKIAQTQTQLEKCGSSLMGR
jgi:hypothetical protein